MDSLREVMGLKGLLTSSLHEREEMEADVGRGSHRQWCRPDEVCLSPTGKQDSLWEESHFGWKWLSPWTTILLHHWLWASPRAESQSKSCGGCSRSYHWRHPPTTSLTAGQPVLSWRGIWVVCSCVCHSGNSIFKQMTNDHTQYFEKQREILRPIEFNIASESIKICPVLSLFIFLIPYTNLHTNIHLTC